MARKGVKITGVNQTIRFVGKQLNKKHRDLLRTGRRIGEDILRKGQDNAPLQTGFLADSGSTRTTDRGKKGIIIEVGFDTPYALRMHEAHYRARPKMTEAQRRALPIRRKGPTQDLSDERPGGGGLYGKRGRKYLTRAWWYNRHKYRSQIKKVAES